MEGDLKEVVGVLMRVLDGGNVSRDEVEDLAFEASGDLRTALNEAYIALLEFAYDCDAGRQETDGEMHLRLEHLLSEIVRLADPAANDRGAN